MRREVLAFPITALALVAVVDAVQDGLIASHIKLSGVTTDPIYANEDWRWRPRCSSAGSFRPMHR